MKPGGQASGLKVLMIDDWRLMIGHGGNEEKGG